MDLDFCPMCGKRLVAEAQQFCGRCGANLVALDSRQTEATTAPDRPKRDHANREADLPRLDGEDRLETSPGSILELAVGLASLAVLALPFVNVSQTESGPAFSVSLLDALQNGTWSSSLEVVLIVLGSAAATALAAVRLGRRPQRSATMPLLGFAAAALGYVWVLLALNGAIDVEPGVGIFLGLLAVGAGGAVCLLDMGVGDSLAGSVDEGEPPLEIPGLSMVGRWRVRESNLDKAPIKAVVHLAYDDAQLILVRRSPEASVVVLDQPTFERCDEMFVRIRNGQGADVSLDWVEGPKAREVEERLLEGGVL